MKQNQATLALAAPHQAARAHPALSGGQTLPASGPAYGPAHEQPARTLTPRQAASPYQPASMPTARKSRRITPLSLLRKVTRNTAGATAIEYGLLAGLMAIGLAAGLGALGDVITLLFNKLETETETVESGLPASDSTP